MDPKGEPTMAIVLTQYNFLPPSKYFSLYPQSSVAFTSPKISFFFAADDVNYSKT